MSGLHSVNLIIQNDVQVTRHVRPMLGIHRTTIGISVVKGQKIVLTGTGLFKSALRSTSVGHYPGTQAATTERAWRIDASRLSLALTRARAGVAPTGLASVIPYASSRHSASAVTPPHQASPRTETPETASEETLADLERRNRLRLSAHWQRIEGRSLPSSQLQRRLSITPQRVHQLRTERKLIGLRLPQHREMYYPLWQFAEDGTPFEVLPRLLDAAAEAHIDPLALDALMTSQDAGDGTSPAELLRRHEDEFVLALVRAAFAHGA